MKTFIFSAGALIASIGCSSATIGSTDVVHNDAVADGLHAGDAVDSSNNPSRDAIADTRMQTDSARNDGASAAVTITLLPSIANLNPAMTAQFMATVHGSSDTAVSWTLQEGPSGGSISSTGLYTAPATVGTYHVVATSHANQSVTAVATAIVNQASNCSALPASGTWESVTPPGEVCTMSVVVDPFDPATVWLGGCDTTNIHGNPHGFFAKSTDCGSTWTHVNTGRNGPALNSGSHWSLVVDPVESGVLYTVLGYDTEGLWKSTNGGVDWDNLFPHGSAVEQAVPYNFIASVSIDPHDHLHLIATPHGGCNDPYGPTCTAETNDGGTTWRIIPIPVGNANLEGSGAYLIDATSLMFATQYDGLWLTTDDGGTWRNVAPSGAWGAEGGEYVVRQMTPGPTGTYFLPSNQGALYSTDARTWSLEPSPGRIVGFAMGGGHLYAADQWSGSFHTALETDPTHWSTFPTPPPPGDGGAAWMSYDAVHHLLYASNFNGGVWRIVTP